ncbi:UPF0481 protein At3g47200-like [Tasmannia lanceolata]|uniref:UPF0481 protein At3g47200-like n=1 Tax=Tasmannia lanceolata TaxID=3420 RepID=UPI0040642B1E
MENADEQMDIDEAWVTSMKHKLAATSSVPASKEQSSIYRVPKHIYETDKKAYEPKIISLGPYHHGKQCLQDMEDHKLRYLNAILSRNVDLSLENYLATIKKMETRARSCYSESTNHLESNEFVQMMVVDGCFIVELFLNHEEAVMAREKGEFVPGRNKEAQEDPIYDTNWLLPLVAHDMLLLENQLPFFVLQSLFELVHKSNIPSFLFRLTFNFFDPLLPRNSGIHPPSDKVLHLLHLFYWHFSPSADNILDYSVIQCFTYNPTLALDSGLLASSNKIQPEPPTLIPSVTELKEAGVKFKPKKMMGSFLDVNFSKGVMEIPHISIYDSTNSLFRNFIAFEQCFPTSRAHFTDYTILMDCLINTPKDVSILKQNKIIHHMLGSDEEVALLFNQLAKGVAVNYEDRYLSKMFKDVNKYCETNWHYWRANLVHSYFSNPWTMMSLAAAIVILILTFIQTFFSIFSYARPP